MSSFNPSGSLSSFGRDYSIEHQIFLLTDSIYFIVNQQSKQQLSLCVKICEQIIWEYLIHLIMQPQDKIWQLNYQLTHVLDNLNRMGFPAHEIYPLHMGLLKNAEQTKLSQKAGSIDSSLWKSSVNRHLFEETLSFLPQSEQLRLYNEAEIIERSSRAYQGLFAQVCATGHVQHYHEVLKATDLWIQTIADITRGQLSRKPQSLKPGAIDFQPEFYAINTLSNIAAMLTVSMEICYSMDRKNGIANLSPVLYTTKFADKDESPAEEEHIYEIEKIIESASAFVCIARTQDNTEQRLVLKILREYKDERYHYGSPEERLTCQKEALRKNAKITPGVYRGLARILRSTLQELEEKCQVGKLQSITLGTIIQEDDEIDHINVGGCEYALVMSYLSDKQRLDLLLREKVSEKQKELYLHSLAIRIEQMHRSFLFLPTEVDEDGYLWGSYKQLLKKLEHNIIYFDLIGQYDLTLYEQYSTLKEDSQHFIKQKRLQDAFEERRKNYVKQCHGDLKTKNIWLETIKPEDNLSHDVHILDAVDFNESYRNIDVLADLAMLVVDVEAIGDEELGAFLEEKYLSLTGQTGDVAKIVMAYYLFEKAIVCAIVCIVYDHCEPHMGHRFLELANKHANELRGLINPPTKKTSFRMRFNSKPAFPHPHRSVDK